MATFPREDLDECMDFGSLIKDTLHVAAEACIDVGAEQGIGADVVRATLVAQALMLAAFMMPRGTDPASFEHMAAKAFEVAAQRHRARTQ